MPVSRIRLLVLLGVFVFAASGLGRADPGPPGDRSIYQLRASVLGAAGVPTASGALLANGTAAQAGPVGVAASAGKVLYAGFWRAIFATPSGVTTNAPEFQNALFPNRPNPFGATTAIWWSLAHTDGVELKIFDAAGRVVRTLVDARMGPGIHRTVWDARDDAGVPVASGVYFYRVASGSFVSSRKMLFVR